MLSRKEKKKIELEFSLERNMMHISATELKKLGVGRWDAYTFISKIKERTLSDPFLTERINQL